MLDLPTLFIVGALGAVCASATMFMIWRAGTGTTYVGHWAVAYALYALGVGFLALQGHASPFISVALANGLISAGLGVGWMGYRAFAGQRRPHDRLLALLGPVLWLLFSLTGPFFADINNRIVFVCALATIYALGNARALEALRQREALAALRPTTILYAIHAFANLMRLLLAIAMPIAPDAPLATTPLISIFMLEASLCIVFAGMAQLALHGQRAERHLRRAAETDVLTGLTNRRSFLAQVRPQVAASDGRGALVLFDLDHFKTINDSFGHAVGDQALMSFSAAIAEEIREPDLFARIGGEEFALFAPHMSEGAAQRLAGYLCRKAAATELVVGGASVRITVSCGIAAIAETGRDFDDLFRAADAALYAAKAAGRNRALVYRKAGHLKTLVSGSPLANDTSGTTSIARML